MAEWDAKLGVWKGSKAAGDIPLPSPLYIFGYGSLLWRPGDLLDPLQCFPCTAVGFMRRFAQRSCDHRGTPSFPGLVVTLIQESDFMEVSGVSQGHDTASYECPGLIWLVPDDIKDSLIAELDFREKGGYSRQLIKVRLHQSTPFHAENDLADALVYIGSVTNPLFDYSLHMQPGLQDGSDCRVDRYSIAPSLGSRSKMADIIQSAVGPSGPNFEYLFGLFKFIHKFSLHDSYISQLTAEVMLRLGAWRHIEHLRILPSHWTLELQSRSVFGWGSNEFNQLIPAHASSASRSVELFPYAGALESLNRFISSCRMESSSSQIFDRLICGGRWSGVLSGDGALTMWGSDLYSALSKRCESESVCSEEAEVSTESMEIAVFDRVVGCSIGHSYAVVLFDSGWVLSFGDNSSGQCWSQRSSHVPFLLPHHTPNISCVHKTEYRLFSLLHQFSSNPVSEAVFPRKIVSSVNHTAAITRSGLLFTWGDMAHGQTLESSWACGEGVSLVDVSCGIKHTVVLDDVGRVWTFGDHRHGALGRTLCPGDSKKPLIDSCPRIALAEDGIRWVKVTSGWSHTIVRGLRVDGSSVVRAFGRCDLNQYPHCGVSTGVKSNPRPVDVSCEGIGSIADVWCGSEFSIAVGEDGKLWGSGWNDHGSLGCGSIDQVSKWVPVVSSDHQQVRLSVNWDGAVSCGGSHCLAWAYRKERIVHSI